MGKKRAMLLILSLLIIVPLISAYEFCESKISEDKLEIIEIIDPQQTNEANWTWTISEEIKTEITVINKNFTERNFELELFLLDESSNIKSFTDTSVKKTLSLNKSEKESSFSFTLKELEPATYFLYAKLTDPNNESICTSLKATSENTDTSIQIKQEEKIIIVRNIKGPKNVTSGNQVEYIVEVINLGNNNEDQVLVISYNNNLGIREEKEIMNLESGKSKNVTFNLTIPKNTTATQENILFSTEYDYNNKTDYYSQSSDKAKPFSIKITQSENETATQPQEENPPIPEEIPPAPELEEALSISEPKETSQTKESKTLYLWIILTITFLLIIMAAIFLFLKYKKTQPKKDIQATSTATSDYIKNIQNQTNSNPQNKPA